MKIENFTEILHLNYDLWIQSRLICIKYFIKKQDFGWQKIIFARSKRKFWQITKRAGSNKSEQGGKNSEIVNLAFCLLGTPE